MKKDIDKKIKKNIDNSTLNKKRKRNISKNDLESYESKIKENNKNKIKKEEIKNYLDFKNNPQNDIYNKFDDINQYSIAKKFYTTTSKYKYNYICQEIKSNNSIQINDAKILSLDDRSFLFLLSNTILYIFEIKEYIKYEVKKEIELNVNNNFNFTSFPKNIFFVNPQEKKPRKNNNNNQNNPGKKKKKITKEILYFCILSNIEKYLCYFDFKKLFFKNIKNFTTKSIAKKLTNNIYKFKIYNNNKILSYNENIAFIQKIYGSPKFKDFKLNNIESVSLLNKNLFSICTPDIVYIYDTYNENIIGDFRTHSHNKKAKLLKPDNNLLMVKSKWDIALYDLESLIIFQKLDLNGVNNPDEPIQKVKQLNNNTIVILFLSCFSIYNLEKNTISYKCNYFEYNVIDNSSNYQGYLIEINPNFILVNNDKKNFYIINSVKGDEIASLNINNDNFSICERIKKYNFIKDVPSDKNIEENKTDNNYILLRNNQNSFILSSIKEEE